MCIIFVNGQQIQNLGTVTYTDDKDILSVIATFSCNLLFPVGSRVQMFSRTDGSLVLTGIITDVEYGDRQMDIRRNSGPYIYNYTMYDFGFYLNKSNTTKQYQNMAITDAITRLCQEINLPLGAIPPTAAITNLTFNNRPVDEVLRALLAEMETATGNRFYFECRNRMLNIFPFQLNNALLGIVGNNLFLRSILTIGGVKISRSIQGVKTAVFVPGDNNRIPPVQRSDPNAVNTFGYIQRVLESNDLNVTNRALFAQSHVSDLITPLFNATIKMMGNHDMRLGVIFNINEPTIELVGRYRIVKSIHSVSGDEHIVTVDLELDQ